MSCTRTEILETAREVLVEEGYDTLTTRAIADRLDLTDAGVHYHFETKDDLLVALIDHREDELVRRLESYDGPPEDRLLAMLRDRFDAAETLLGVPTPPPSYQLLVATSNADDTLRERLREYKERYVEMLTETIQEGVERGVFEAETPERVARTLTAMVEGAEVRAALDQSPTPLVRGTVEYVLADLYTAEVPDLEVAA